MCPVTPPHITITFSGVNMVALADKHDMILGTAELTVMFCLKACDDLTKIHAFPWDVDPLIFLEDEKKEERR